MRAPVAGDVDRAGGQTRCARAPRRSSRASRLRCFAFRSITVSRSDRVMPAARTAPNDDPYSTMRCSSRYHQTRWGMWCTSPCAPVAIDERQTGVSDGKVDAARAYVPCSSEEADRRRVGGLEHRRRQAVDHDQDDRLRLSDRARASADRRDGRARGGAGARRAAARRAPRGSRAPARTRALRRRARRRRAASPCRRACRRAAAHRRRAAPSRTLPQHGAGERRRAASSHCQNAKPIATATAAATTAAGITRRSAPAAATPNAAPSPARIPIVYQDPISGPV